jgi:excisionase family DNA binding protein
MSKKSLKSSVAVLPAPVSFPEPLLLDIRGAASILSSTVWTVRNLLWSKQIPFVKIGRRFLIDPADLRAYVARLKAA